MPPVMTVGKAISMLRSAIVNARIYPKGSQMIETSLKGAHQALETCLLDAEPIIISDLHGKLCVNGKEVAEAKDFRPFLVAHEAQSLKVFKGITAAEVGTLLEGLGSKKDQLGAHKSLGEFLKANGATHVQVEQIEFVELKKGEVVVQQVMALLEQSTGDTNALASSLEESLHLAEGLPDEASKKEVRKKMASHMASLPPSELRDLFESKLPEAVEKSGLREDVVQAMSREKLEETLEEVNKWYKQIKSESSSEFETVEKLNGLKSFLGKILHSPASKTVPFALYEELLNVGLLEQVPTGVKKGENSGLLAEVEHLLSQPSEALLELPVRQRFPELLKAMCAMALDDRLFSLTEKMLENFHNPAALVRETTAKTVRVFEEVLAANRKEKAFSQILSTLHTMAESESAPDVYGEIAQCLQVAAMELLVNWRFEETSVLLGILRRHAREESPIGQKKKHLAAKALHDFAVRSLDTLCADLNAPLKDRQNGSYRVLAELSEEAVGPLVEAIKRSNDQRSRQAAVQALRRIGPVVKEPLLQQMSIGMPGDILVKLLPVLEEFADASLLPNLTSLLHHPDGPVRRHVAQLLARVKEPKVQSLITGLLDDSDPEVQVEAVRLIGELKLNLASLELAKRLSVAPEVVQEEICISLGNLGEKRAISDLIALLQTQSSFWHRRKGTSDAVRIRAVWALGQLLPDANAEKAIAKVLKDSNPNLQRAAQVAMARTSLGGRKAA